jgi:PAS domain-containing protein
VQSLIQPSCKRSYAVLQPSSPSRENTVDLPLPDPALREVLESIREPALLYLPGGRIAAVNRAAARLTAESAVGRTLDELLDRFPARSADGRRILRGDLPYTRALRGEIVGHGERIEITLPDGSPYSALVTSTPIIVEGKVVAALSVWHDFDAYARRLAERRLPQGDEGSPDAA